MESSAAPFTVTIATDDAFAAAAAPISVARLLVQLPVEWRAGFRPAGRGQVELRGYAPDGPALRRVVGQVLGDPALRGWRLLVGRG